MDVSPYSHLFQLRVKEPNAAQGKGGGPDGDVGLLVLTFETIEYDWDTDLLIRDPILRPCIGPVFYNCFCFHSLEENNLYIRLMYIFYEKVL